MRRRRIRTCRPGCLPNIFRGVPFPSGCRGVTRPRRKRTPPPPDPRSESGLCVCVNSVMVVFLLFLNGSLWYLSTVWTCVLYVSFLLVCVWI